MHCRSRRHRWHAGASGQPAGRAIASGQATTRERWQLGHSPAACCYHCVVPPRHRLLLLRHAASPLPVISLSLARARIRRRPHHYQAHSRALDLRPQLTSRLDSSSVGFIEARRGLYTTPQCQSEPATPLPDLTGAPRPPPSAHHLDSLPRCLPAVEIAADDFVVASSSFSTARRRSSSTGVPSRLDSGEDAAKEHPSAATGEDDSSYPA